MDAHKWCMMGHPPWTTVGNSKKGEHARPPRDELQGLQLLEKTPERQRLLHRVPAESASGLWGAWCTMVRHHQCLPSQDPNVLPKWTKPTSTCAHPFPGPTLPGGEGTTKGWPGSSYTWRLTSPSNASRRAGHARGCRSQGRIRAVQGFHSTLASQVVVKVHLSQWEHTTCFIYQFVSLIYNFRARRHMPCAADAVGSRPVLPGLHPSGARSACQLPKSPSRCLGASAPARVHSAA